MNTVPMSLAIECLKVHVQNNTPVMLWSPPGCGKTQMTFQCAETLTKETGETWGIIDWRANLRDPVDARGLPIPDLAAGTTTWLKPGELPIDGRHGKRGILLLDEINTASPSMQNVCLQMVLERRVGEHKLDDGWVAVATGNRAKDKAIVTRMSSALKNRFAHLDIEPELDAWKAHAIEQGASPYLIAFLSFRKEFLHRMPADDTVNAYPTPRTWLQHVNKLLDQPARLRLHLVASLVGHDIACELEGFLRVYAELPTLQEIVEGPEIAKVPAANLPSARYAVSGMMARAMTRRNIGSILEYAKRLGREFEILTMIDAKRYNPAIVNCSEYGSFCIANQDLML